MYAAFGDEFIDIWVYITLKANINRLATTAAYVEAYANEALMTSEYGYYFTALRVATDYIKRLSVDKFNLPHRIDLTRCSILVAERRKYELFCATAPAFQLAPERLVLGGYKIFAVLQWLRALQRFYSVLIVPTGNPNDKITVSILRVVSELPLAQQTTITDTFLRPTAPHVFSRETINGTILLANADFPPPNLDLVPIPDGDFEAFEPALMAMVNLQQFGFALDRHLLQPQSVTPELISTIQRNLSLSTIAATDAPAAVPTPSNDEPSAPVTRTPNDSPPGVLELVPPPPCRQAPSPPMKRRATAAEPTVEWQLVTESERLEFCRLFDLSPEQPFVTQLTSLGVRIQRSLKLAYQLPWMVRADGLLNDLVVASIVVRVLHSSHPAAMPLTDKLLPSSFNSNSRTSTMQPSAPRLKARCS